MKIAYYIRSVGVALILAASGEVYALTVYDVVQLSRKDYSDQDIVALINATGSAFKLQAEDIPRLMELRVSETVIQAMLKAVPADPPTDPAASRTRSEPKTHGAPDHADQAGPGARPQRVTTVSLAPGRAAAHAGFGSKPFEEAGSGGHRHRVITLSGIQLFVLRDEAQNTSVSARAGAVAQRLEEAAALVSGTFQPTHLAGKHVVMFYTGNTLRTVAIVTVSAHDAYAYQRRSGRRVTPEVLAAYWSDLLSDYWSLAFAGEPATRLTNFHEGEALRTLSDRLRVLNGSVGSKLAKAFESLPPQEREHLLRLASTVPREFGAGKPHVAEHK